MKSSKKFLFFLPLILSGAALISCTQVYEFYKQDKKTNKSPKFFTNDDYKSLFDSIYSNNNSIRKNKLIEQLNVDPIKAEVELKYSLAISRPFFPRQEPNGYSTLVKDSNYTVNNYLTKYWFFLLNNIDKISFVYNPYTTRLDKYRATNGSPDYIKTALANGTKLEKEAESAQTIIRIKNKNFQFIKIDKDQTLLPGSATYYLIFDGNKFIRLTTFADDEGQPQVRLDYNLFLLNKSDKNPDPFLFANEIETWINKKEQDHLKEKINEKKSDLEDNFNDIKEDLNSKISKLQNELNELDNKIDESDSSDSDSTTQEESNHSNDHNSESNTSPQKSNDSSGDSSDDENEDDEDDNSESNPELDQKRQEWLKKITSRKLTFGEGLDLSAKSENGTKPVESTPNLDSNDEQKKEFYNSQIKSLQSELEQKTTQYEKDLKQVDQLATQDFVAEKKQINESNFFTDITSDIAQLNTSFEFAKYSLASIDIEPIQQSFQKHNKNNPNTHLNRSQNDYYYQFFKKYIDPSLNVTTNEETPDERETKNIFNYILELAWGHNEAGKVEFLNQQNNPEHIEQLEKKWKKISDSLGSSENIDPDTYKLYESFVRENWYFILQRIGKLELVFKNWFSFPDKEYNGQIVSHSKEFKKEVAEKDPIPGAIVYANSNLESISEGDTSKLADNFRDLYILKQNSLINIRIDTAGDNPKITLNPLILYFQKPRSKISVKVLTEIFHQALYHYSQKAYDSFEKDFVKKFRYGLPAQMVLKERNEKDS